MNEGGKKSCISPSPINLVIVLNTQVTQKAVLKEIWTFFKGLREESVGIGVLASLFALGVDRKIMYCVIWE